MSLRDVIGICGFPWRRTCFVWAVILMYKGAVCFNLGEKSTAEVHHWSWFIKKHEMQRSIWKIKHFRLIKKIELKFPLICIFFQVRWFADYFFKSSRNRVFFYSSIFFKSDYLYEQFTYHCFLLFTLMFFLVSFEVYKNVVLLTLKNTRVLAELWLKINLHFSATKRRWTTVKRLRVIHFWCFAERLKWLI